MSVVQAEPLRAYPVGAAPFPVWVAWNPKLTDAPGASVALWPTFVAVTRPEAGA